MNLSLPLAYALPSQAVNVQRTTINCIFLFLWIQNVLSIPKSGAMDWELVGSSIHQCSFTILVLPAYLSPNTMLNILILLTGKGGKKNKKETERKSGGGAGGSEYDYLCKCPVAHRLKSLWLCNHLSSLRVYLYQFPKYTGYCLCQDSMTPFKQGNLPRTSGLPRSEAF